MKVFFSYNFNDESFVQRVSYYIGQQPEVEPYCYADDKHSDTWRSQIGRAIKNCEAFILFVGKEFGCTEEKKAGKKFIPTQVKEVECAEDTVPNEMIIVVNLPKYCELPDELIFFNRYDPIKVSNTDDFGAEQCAKEIVERFRMTWVPDDGLPVGYPFSYEKEIIEEYVKGEGRLPGKWIEKGCPAEWPVIEKMPYAEGIANPVTEEVKVIGKFREKDAKIIVDVRSRYHCRSETEDKCLIKHNLTFLEAGPRESLCFPVNGAPLTIGILVSGGIAPGINAVIDGIVGRHTLYRKEYSGRKRKYNLNIFGYLGGFNALLHEGNNYKVLNENLAKEMANQGGSIITTSRADELLDFKNPRKRAERLDTMVQKLRRDGVDILYIIGGDGSMKAAHVLWKRAKDIKRESDKELSVVAIPKTMDNDILWVWQSFGFLSAVERAKRTIQQLYTEAKSNPRLCIIQLFGSDSGFVASHAALASGVCDAVLIPEIEFTMQGLFSHIKERLQNRYDNYIDVKRGDESPYSIIVMAETSIPQNLKRYIDDSHIALEDDEKRALKTFEENKRRVYGQTPDALRTAGLKIVSRILQKKIRNEMGYNPFWQEFRVFTNEPRHLIRAISPSVSDVIFGQRLGSLAVDNAMAGYTDFMISQWLTEYVLVPLKLVVLGRKRVPKDGIFWKSVLASTGQPANLT